MAEPTIRASRVGSTFVIELHRPSLTRLLGRLRYPAR